MSQIKREIKDIKILCITLIIVFLVTTITFPVYADSSVVYVDREWNGEEVADETKTSTDYITITTETTIWGAEGIESWYVLSSDITASARIEVNGNVNLILSDGYTLTATKGIHVTGSNTLTIYGQTAGTGKLVSTGVNLDSGIGGNRDEACGNITINGGTIETTGASGSYIHDGENTYCGGAGIGGGSGHYYKNDNNETVDVFVSSESIITINGGTVNAVGKSGAAGIGGGWLGDMGTIIINGGNINSTVSSSAPNGSYGAGIGGGAFSGTGSIIINGGNIYSQSYGSGIGSGEGGKGTNITINGGNIETTNSGVGIGGTSCKLTINGGYVKGISNNRNYHSTTNGTYYGSGLGGGYQNGASTITLNWTSLDDRISMSSIYGNTVNIASGKKFANENDPYVSLNVSQIKSLQNVTLVPVKYITYREGTWDETANKTVFANKEYYRDAEKDFTYVESDVTSLTEGLYVVYRDTDISKRIEVSGNVSLILSDGFTLNALKGIRVPEGSSLTIYGQANGTGKLTAIGDDEQAGIGSSLNENCGDITIHGGTIAATGGTNASGIGGGNGGNGGKVTILGGTVTATG